MSRPRSKGAQDDRTARCHGRPSRDRLGRPAADPDPRRRCAAAGAVPVADEATAEGGCRPGRARHRWPHRDRHVGRRWLRRHRRAACRSSRRPRRPALLPRPPDRHRPRRLVRPVPAAQRRRCADGHDRAHQPRRHLGRVDRPVRGRRCLRPCRRSARCRWLLAGDHGRHCRRHRARRPAARRLPRT